MDGVQMLDALLRRAGYPSIVAAVAEHTVFLPPSTVFQAGGSPIFPVIRDMRMNQRGVFAAADDGRPVMLDDNTTPTNAFLWSAGLRKGPDVQFNHVWSESRNPDLYTALWNLCATPAFLAKTTDGSNHPEVTAALRFRAFDLFGWCPQGESAPTEPAGYPELKWAPHPPPIGDLEQTLRARLRSTPRSRTALACRTIGWRFSNWVPDETI